jgi:hypothetical protein
VNSALKIVLNQDFSVTNDVHIRFEDTDCGEEKLNFGILISSVSCTGDRELKKFDLLY